MSASTGPILAAAGIVLANDIVTQQTNPHRDVRVVIGALVTAVGLSVVEKAAPGAAVLFAWLVVAGVTVVRLSPKQPSPLESLLAWYKGNG